MSWIGRLGLMERLSEAGVDEITLPSHTTIDEERDIVKAYHRLGLKTPLVAKGPGLELPLRGEWKDTSGGTPDSELRSSARSISGHFRTLCAISTVS